ncbi:MAG: polymer-forming cytoskeletal protein [Rhodothermales bacterium]|nr:polymer-forming cytoskeletal protein [Rhodothermales bacterium]
MSIFIILIVIAWALLAFAPTWLEAIRPKECPTDGENISDSDTYMVPAFGSKSLISPGGPAFATIFDSESDAAHQTGSARRSHRPSSQISIVPATELADRRLADLTIVDKDFTLRSGSRFSGNISVNGTIRIESDASFTGNITGSKSVIVCQAATVDGDIDTVGDIRVESDARITGSILSNSDIWVYENARIGSTDHPVNVRANEVIVAPTARIYGSIWARKNGVRFPQTQAA